MYIYYFQDCIDLKFFKHLYFYLVLMRLCLTYLYFLSLHYLFYYQLAINYWDLSIQHKSPNQLTYQIHQDSLLIWHHLLLNLQSIIVPFYNFLYKKSLFTSILPQMLIFLRLRVLKMVSYQILMSFSCMFDLSFD